MTSLEKLEDLLESLPKEKTTSKSNSKRLTKDLPLKYKGKDIKICHKYEQLLDELPEPTLVFKHFMACLETPRPSSKLEKMHQRLKQIAKILEVEYTEDNIGNVVLRKAPTTGFENKKGVVIQCHMDMVCTKKEEIKHDFENDPINAYIIKENNKLWLKAEGTTLGADDGIGLAAGLALLEDPYLNHGLLEILITVDEETTMNGAMKLSKKPFLKNNILINVDSEEDHKICIGCAGGFGKEFKYKMNTLQFNENKLNNFVVYQLNIKNLLGGHTGVQIHCGHANAIQLLVRMLNYVITDLSVAINLINISGGNAQNAIPCYSECKILLSKNQVSLFKENVLKYWNKQILVEFKNIEKDMKFSLKEINNNKSNISYYFDIESTNNIINLMMILPHGIIRMSPNVKGLVQTSIAFSELNSNNNIICCGLFARSSSMEEMIELNRKLNSIAKVFNNKNLVVSDMLDLFPGWDPNTNSFVLKQIKLSHCILFEDSPQVYAVHAGLECGLIKDRYSNMDCVSIGPLIHGAHSTDEKLCIDSVNDFYIWLRETIQQIGQFEQ